MDTQNIQYVPGRKKNNIPSVEQLPASDGAVSLGAPACPEWDCKGMSCHGGRQEAQRNNACFTVRTSLICFSPTS